MYAIICVFLFIRKIVFCRLSISFYENFYTDFILVVLRMELGASIRKEPEKTHYLSGFGQDERPPNRKPGN
jgi:hypothetical protein